MIDDSSDVDDDVGILDTSVLFLVVALSIVVALKVNSLMYPARCLKKLGGNDGVDRVGEKEAWHTGTTIGGIWPPVWFSAMLPKLPLQLVVARMLAEKFDVLHLGFL